MSDKANLAINGWLDEIIDAEPSRWLRLYLRFTRPFIVRRVKQGAGRLIEEYVSGCCRTCGQSLHPDLTDLRDSAYVEAIHEWRRLTESRGYQEHLH